MYGDIAIVIKFFPNMSLVITAIGLFSVELVPLILLSAAVYSKLVINLSLIYYFSSSS